MGEPLVEFLKWKDVNLKAQDVEKLFHVCEGGFRILTRYLATVDSATL